MDISYWDKINQHIVELEEKREKARQKMEELKLSLENKLVNECDGSENRTIYALKFTLDNCHSLDWESLCKRPVINLVKSKDNWMKLLSNFYDDDNYVVTNGLKIRKNNVKGF